jgi:hypothetical protein
MTLENRKTAIKVRLRAFFSSLIFISIIIVIYTTRLFNSPIFGLNKYEYTILFVLVYIFTLLFSYSLNLNYIYYSDDGYAIIFRYYSLRIFSSRKSSIEIPKKYFVRFETKTSFLGLKENIILYQQIKTAEAKYPPISITSLTRKEKNKIKKSLSRYVKK